jgi:hypothetical protein
VSSIPPFQIFRYSLLAFLLYFHPLQFVAQCFAGIHELTAAPNYEYKYILCGRYGESVGGGGEAVLTVVYYN